MPPVLSALPVFPRTALAAVLLAVLLAAIWAVPAARAQPVAADRNIVGYVRTVSGDGALLRDGQPVHPAVGDPVRRADIVETGPGGTLGITFIDNTMLSFGPNTRFVLEDYAFRPLQQRYSFFGRILRGTFVYISGDIGTQSPDSVRLETPWGIIGIRGTRFAGSVTEPPPR